MKVDDLKLRLRPRSKVAVTLEIPEDVLTDLQRVALALDFSSHLALMRAYIGQGLRQDLARLHGESELSRVIESLRRQGVADDVIATAIAEAHNSADAA